MEQYLDTILLAMREANKAVRELQLITDNPERSKRLFEIEQNIQRIQALTHAIGI